MENLQLGKNTKITRVKASAVAGTSDINSDIIDMANYEGVLFIVALGAITSGAVTSIKGQQGAASSMSDAADLVGTGVTIADTDDDKVVWLDIKNPQERYVRCVLDRGTQNAVLDGIIAIQYGPRKAPTTHDATTVLGGEAHVSPAEGTA